MGIVRERRETSLSGNNGNEQELTNEELLELAEKEIKELKEALRKTVPSQFHTAKELPKVPYVNAGDAYGFHKKLLQASIEATKTDDYWRKVVFKIAEDGRLFDPELEAAKGQDSD